MKAPIFDYYPVRYTPKYQNTLDIENYYGRVEEIYNNFESLKYLETFCSTSGAKLNYNSSLIDAKSQYAEISLLVTFNWKPRLQNIELIKFIYGSYFNNIVFCGPDLMQHYEAIKEKFKRFDSFAFIEMDTVGGIYHYYCMTKAIELNLITKGYLLMSDDVLLKYWMLNSFDIKKVWFPFKLECSTYELNTKFRAIDFGNWYKPWGLNALLNVWTHNFSPKKTKNFTKNNYNFPPKKLIFNQK